MEEKKRRISNKNTLIEAGAEEISRIDCLVKALAGNVRQARLMKNTRRPYPPFGEPSSSHSLTLTGHQSQPMRGSPLAKGPGAPGISL